MTKQETRCRPKESFSPESAQAAAEVYEVFEREQTIKIVSLWSHYER